VYPPWTAGSDWYVPPSWPLAGYGLKLVTAPAGGPVTLDEAKDHLFASDLQADADVGRKLAEAVADVERESGRQLVTATWLLVLDNFPRGDCGAGPSGGYGSSGFGMAPPWGGAGYSLGLAGGVEIRLPIGPVQAVNSVKYYDGGGVQRTLVANTDYYAAVRGEPGRVVPCYGKTWPVVQLGRPEAVEVEFVAGYGGASAVPADLKRAVKVVLADHWRNRGDDPKVGVSGEARAFPDAARRIIANHRFGGYR
jgi:hypothetical protein